MEETMRKVSISRTLIVCSAAVTAFAIASSAWAQTATTTTPTTTAVPTPASKKPTSATPQMIKEAIQRSQARTAKFQATGVPEQWGSEEPFTFNPAAQ
jgi:hypothetical protein